MESIYRVDDDDVSFSIDMDDLGVIPKDSNKILLRDPIEEFFGNEKTMDFTVYSAEFQLMNNGKRLTTNENETSLSDDEDDDGNSDYVIDPETGEKIFREVTFNSNNSLASSLPNEQWIEEYLSNIESSSANQILPHTTTDSSFVFENFPFLFPEDSSHQTDSDWFSNLIDIPDNSDSIMVTDSMLSSEFLGDNETTSNRIPNLITDDEYSTSNSSDQSRQQRSYSSVDNNDEITFIEAKLEKIEHEENPLSHMIMRRSSIRTTSQGQLDEDALHQYNIPLTVDDITQSSTEEYNRHLIRLNHLSAEQMHVIKDIRRRGKNKIAAQNCRKRKLVNVGSLLEEVDELKRVKQELEERKQAYQHQIAETRHQYEYLHRQVLPDRQLPPAIIVT